MTASLSSFRLGLRAKLALSLVLVLGVLIASGAYVVWRVIADELYRSIGEQHTLLAKQVAAELDDKLRIVRNTLEGVAQAVPVELADRPKLLSAEIAGTPVLHALFDRIAVLSAGGVVLATAPEIATLHGRNLADREHIRHVTRTREPYVSRPLYGPGTGRPIVNVVVPRVSPSGELKLIFVGVLYLLHPNYVGSVRAHALGKSGYFVVADGHGTIISHRDAERVMQPAGADPLLQRISAGANSSEDLSLANGSRALVSYARLRETDWTVAAVYPAAEAYASITETRGTLAMLTFVALLLSPLFAWLIAGPLTHRLDALARQVRAARAAPGARLELGKRGRDEVAELAVAFNALLGRVEEREQQNRVLALGIDQSEGAVVMLDTGDRVTRWSRGAERMFGWTAAEALGRSVRELYAPMLAEADLLAKRERVRAREVLRLEAPRMHKSGRSIDTAVTSSGVFDERGEFIGTMLTYTDVTEAKRAERALRESEERLRIAHEAGRIASWVWTAGEDRARWSGEYEMLLDLEPGSYSGRFEDYLKLLHPEDREVARRTMVECLKHELPNYRAQERLILRDGSVRWLETAGQAFYGPDGRAMRMAGIVRDITAGKLAEQAVRESEERFASAFHASPASTALFQRDSGRLVLVNEGFEKLYGYSREEVLGRTIAELGVWADMNERARAMALLDAEGSVRDFEAVIRTRNGDLRHAQFAFELIGIRGVAHVMGVAIDVTERRRYQETLERSVNERTADLQRANRELESFSYTVSHDLRAPLRAIHGFSQLIKLDHAECLPQAAQQLLHRVQDNALRMSELINDLLEFARIGRRELVKERVDTHALVALVLEELAEAGAAAQAEITLGELPDAWGDRGLLRIVWSNLLANALKFSRKAVRPCVRVSGERRGEAVEFSVCDNGAGFDMRYAHKLFGVFQRLHSDAEFEGTGAGLSIVQRIVDRHGGRVSAEGEPGNGATFGFSLPGR